MRTKLLKSKNVLLALVTAMLVVCLAFVGFGFTNARADGVTFGAMYGDAVDANLATVGGNATDGYTMTYNSNFWNASAGGPTFVRLPVSNYSTGYLSFEVDTPKNANVRVFIFQGGGWWNTTDIINETVYAGKTRYVSVNVANIIANYNANAASEESKINVSNFDLTFNLYETNGENTVTINNLRITDEEVIPPTPEVPEVVEIGEWSYASTTSGAITLNDTITGTDGTTYKGMGVTWDKNVGVWSYLTATVFNFDPAKTNKLCVSFYTDKDMVLGVWGAEKLDEAGHEPFTAGYHKRVFDVSGLTSLSALNMYIDSSTTYEFEGTKHLVFDYIGFYDDTKELNVAVDECENASPTIFTVSNTDNKLSLQWNSQAASNQYPRVKVPVENWQPFNRFLILDMSCTEDINLRVFLNNGTLSEYNDPVDASSLTDNSVNGGYTDFTKGRHLVCLDTQAAYAAGLIDAAGDNKLYIYHRGPVATESVTKTVTFNQIYFSETPIASVSLKVTVDYAAGTVDFDDTLLDVSTAEDFATLVAKGGNVGPGKLYIRAKSDNTMTAEVTLVKATLTQENAPTAYVKENSISYTHVTGYEFKMGTEEWGTTDHWDNLEANKDYEIQIRRLASDTAFASDPITVTVHIEGEYVPVSINLGGYGSRDNFIQVSKNGDTLTLSYDLAQVNGNYYFVTIPVENWRAGNQYLIVDFTLNEDTKLRYYLNSLSTIGEWGPYDQGVIGPDHVYNKGRYVICLDTAGAFALGAVSESETNKITVYCDGGLSSATTLNKEIKINKIYFSEEQIEDVALNVNVNYAAGTVDYDDAKLDVATDAEFTQTVAKGGAVTPGKLYIRSKANNEITAEINLVKLTLTEKEAPKATGTENSISFEHATGYEFKFDDAAEWSATKVWNNLEAGSTHTVTMRKAATDSAFASNEITITVSVGTYEGASVSLEDYVNNSDEFTVNYAGEKLTISWDAANVVGEYHYITLPAKNWHVKDKYLIVDMSFSAGADYRFFYYNGAMGFDGPNEKSALSGYVKYQKGRHIVCFDLSKAITENMISAGDNNTIYIYLRGDNSSMVKSVTVNQIYFSETEVANVDLTVSVDYAAGTVDYDDEKVEVATDAAFTQTVAKGGAVQPGKLYIRSKANHEFSAELNLVKGTIFDAPEAIVTKGSISFALAEGYEYKFGASGEWGTINTWDNLQDNTEYVIYIRKAATEDSFASDEITVTKRTSKIPGKDYGENNGNEKTSGCNCNGSIAAVSLPVALLLLAGSWFIIRRRRSTNK